jgi:hypothetical protein
MTWLDCIKQTISSLISKRESSVYSGDYHYTVGSPISPIEQFYNVIPAEKSNGKNLFAQSKNVEHQKKKEKKKAMKKQAHLDFFSVRLGTHG